MEKLSYVSDSYEDHLNAQSLLSEIVEYKQVYQVLCSQRSLESLKANLDSECYSSKVNTLVLLINMVAKYKSNESFQKKINIESLAMDGSPEDLTAGMDDDEDVLIFNGDTSESETFNFVKDLTLH